MQNKSKNDREVHFFYRLMRDKHAVYLLLGSNLGDKLMNLQQALMDIQLCCDEVMAISEVYETTPWGVDHQDTYLNMVVSVQTTLYPFGLLQQLQTIEHSMGRITKGDMAPRHIDIDILLFEDFQLQTDKLVIPHPRMHLRRFVLQPLADITAEKIVPGFNRTVQDLLDICTDTGEVKVYSRERDAV